MKRKRKRSSQNKLGRTLQKRRVNVKCTCELHVHKSHNFIQHTQITVPGFTGFKSKSTASRRKKVLGKRKDPQSMPKEEQYELKAPTFTFSPAAAAVERKKDESTEETNEDLLEFEKAFGKQEMPTQKGIPTSKNPFQDLEDSSEDEDVVKNMYTLTKPTFSFGDDKEKNNEEEKEEVELDTTDLQLSKPIFEVISTKKKKKKRNRRRR